jgi:chaperonin cofactor prefoldin
MSTFAELQTKRIQYLEKKIKQYQHELTQLKSSIQKN